MNLSGFDDCMQAANDIQSGSTGQVSGHLGNRVNTGLDSNDHISQFNAGLDAMETLHNHYIPLSEAGVYTFDTQLMKDNVSQIENWLKVKLTSENGYKPLNEKRSDVDLSDKTIFLKDMNELFSQLDSRNELIKSLSAYITTNDISSVRDLIAKLSNSTSETEESK